MRDLQAPVELDAAVPKVGEIQPGKYHEALSSRAGQINDLGDQQNAFNANQVIKGDALRQQDAMREYQKQVQARVQTAQANAIRAGNTAVGGINSGLGKTAQDAQDKGVQIIKNNQPKNPNSGTTGGITNPSGGSTPSYPVGDYPTAPKFDSVTKRNAEDAVIRAQNTKTYPVGMCLNFVWNMLDGVTKKGLPDANSAWTAARQKEQDMNPPAGAPVYWSSGKYGHIAIAAGNGMVYSTDYPVKGRVGLVSIADITKQWGMGYRGWSHDYAGSSINGVP